MNRCLKVSLNFLETWENYIYKQLENNETYLSGQYEAYDEKDDQPNPRHDVRIFQYAWPEKKNKHFQQLCHVDFWHLTLCTPYDSEQVVWPWPQVNKCSRHVDVTHIVSL